MHGTSSIDDMLNRSAKLIRSHDIEVCVYMYIPIAPAGMEIENQELFLEGNIATTHIRTQVVEPS